MTNKIKRSSLQKEQVVFKLLVAVIITIVLIFQGLLVFGQDNSAVNDTREVKPRPNQNSVFNVSDLENGLLSLHHTDYKGAVVYFNAALRLNPANDFIIFQKGLAFFKMKEYRSAITEFNKAIAQEGKNAEYFYQRALAKTYVDQMERSILDCDSAILLKPDYADAFLVRGISKAIVGETEGSTDDIRKAISLKDNFGEAYYNLGLNYYDLRDQENAKLNFERASQLGFEIKNLEAYLRK